MVATGEYIRMTNYVDDIAATLRRIVVGSTTMTEEERKRLAEYMRKVEPNYPVIVEQLEGSK
jgi:dihydrodipicolinate reductase